MYNGLPGSRQEDATVLVCSIGIHRRRKLLKAGGAQEVVINFELFAVKLFSIINV